MAVVVVGGTLGFVGREMARVGRVERRVFVGAEAGVEAAVVVVVVVVVELRIVVALAQVDLGRFVGIVAVVEQGGLVPFVVPPVE